MTTIHLSFVLAFTGLAILQVGAFIDGARQARRMVASVAVEPTVPFLRVIAVTSVPVHLFTVVSVHLPSSAAWWNSSLAGGWDFYTAAMVIVLPFFNMLTVTLLAIASVGLAAVLLARVVPSVASQLPGRLVLILPSRYKIGDRLDGRPRLRYL